MVCCCRASAGQDATAMEAPAAPPTADAPSRESNLHCLGIMLMLVS